MFSPDPPRFGFVGARGKSSAMGFKPSFKTLHFIATKRFSFHFASAQAYKLPYRDQLKWVAMTWSLSSSYESDRYKNNVFRSLS